MSNNNINDCWTNAINELVETEDEQETETQRAIEDAAKQSENLFEAARW